MPICLLWKNTFYSIKKNFKPKFEDIVQSRRGENATAAWACDRLLIKVILLFLSLLFMCCISAFDMIWVAAVCGINVKICSIRAGVCSVHLGCGGVLGPRGSLRCLCVSVLMFWWFSCEWQKCKSSTSNKQPYCHLHLVQMCLSGLAADLVELLRFNVLM